MIDLRSDTVTKPTEGMLETMMSAEVGDDIFGEDPSINKLEQKCAELFGKDSALFCPSGTMANQIGINILTQPYEEVICYEGSHIYRYEGGGLMGNSGISVRLLSGDRGRITADDVKANINPDDQHYPTSKVVGIENTVNKGGGSYYRMAQINEIKQVADENSLKMHLDGARLFNAIEETGDSTLDYGDAFDTISICLSKGLGAPVGSVLVYNKELDRAARRQRKVFGGGMRQAGFLAAAGIYALDNHVERLSVDHSRARELGRALEECSWVDKVLPVDTNIVIFEVSDRLGSNRVFEGLQQAGIGSVIFGPKEIRFVTHLDFTDDHLDQTLEILRSLSF